MSVFVVYKESLVYGVFSTEAKACAAIDPLVDEARRACSDPDLVIAQCTEIEVDSVLRVEKEIEIWRTVRGVVV